MPPVEPNTLATVVQANDKLLKAVVTLLALKDEHLLAELNIVFSAAARPDAPLGAADEATWDCVRRKLAMIRRLVDVVDKEAADALDSGNPH